MATLALSLAGQFAGGLVGGPLGATIGRALGALAGSAVDGLLFGEHRAESTGSDIRLQGSSEGGAVPRLFGWSRLSGNIIWARELERLGSESSGAKAMSEPGEDIIAASFAVAFCEGVVSHLGRIWADGQLLDTDGLTLRFYRGTEDQLPDGLIEASQGAAPAYRGVCYLVIEQLPLNRFGNRIPHLSVELCRVVGDLEPDMRAVTLIPGASEFGYDPSPRVRVVGPGQTAGENTHVSATVSDWTCSIDELMALCPNLEHVALVVAWFGDDLRCGACQISPRVEAPVRAIEGVEWSVVGRQRAEVPVVSTYQGGPACGGTPSDGAVLAAIADLRARGLSVTLYPLLLMDVPAANGLPDPHGASQQATYPWRGRITCHPAPGRPGSPDQTAAATTQVTSFVTGYRQMVLHYAGIAAASGAETLIIGSEMVGLSTVRGPANSFPFVSALVALAAEVRAIVGGATKLTYAADWTEYSGHQPGGGAKFFHLDPLWASPHIDAVGIDNYMPLADWRDGQGHLDAGMSAAGYDLNYLKANVAGGEGYDWYYVSPADRQAQLRTPISDGARGEPWVWRYKDIRNWWSHAHHDRPGGVRNASATAWLPGSKPVWFTELGCGAVDKGANQPNIFGDPKSAESGRPYFSSGAPDPLIQRQVLRAHHAWWRNSANNPAGMVDINRLYLWTWDARPYPAFPAQTDIWSDGTNHRNGHWLTGRLGAMTSDELAVAIAAQHGVTLSAEPAAPFVMGCVLAQATTARDALGQLVAASGLSLRNRVDGLHLGAARRAGAFQVLPDALVGDDAPVLKRRRGDPAEAPGRLALSYQDRERDYLNAAVTALVRADGPLVGEGTALTLDASSARLAAERMLDSRAARYETLDFALPPAALALEPGDLIDLIGVAEGPFEISQIRDGLSRHITALTVPASTAVATGVERSFAVAATTTVRARPLILAAHLPPLPGDWTHSRLLLAAYAQPWPGPIQLTDAATGAALAELTRPAALGTLASPLPIGPVAVWDRGTIIEIDILAGHLAGADEPAVLAGSNRLAIQTDAGVWEVIGFAAADLVGLGRYRLSGLLRGQQGTAPGVASAGRSVIVLDANTVVLPVDPQLLGETIGLRSYAGARDLDGTAISVETTAGPALPLAPVHLRARRGGSDVTLSWVRRSRADGDAWGVAETPLEHVPERYRVQIFDSGALVRTLDCAATWHVYAQGDQFADFGALPSTFSFSVAQVSPVLGAGYVAQGEFNG